MPKIRLTPQEKKRIAYLRDHYNRGGESKIAWRRGKRLKKRKAIHSCRRGMKVSLTKLGDDNEPDLTSMRRLTTLRQKEIKDWGVISLRSYVSMKHEAKRKFLR